MSTAAMVWEMPDWLCVGENEKVETTIERAKKQKGARYVPWKVKDFIVGMEGVPGHIQLFLLTLHKHTYNAHGEPSQKDLAKEMGRTRRTVQNDMAEAEKAGLIEVERHSGSENVYRFAIGLLLKAGAFFLPKPKPEAPAQPQAPSVKPIKKSPGFFRVFVPRKENREEQDRVNREGLQKLGDALRQAGIIPPLPPRSG